MATRFPAQIGSWLVEPGDYSVDGLLTELRASTRRALDRCDRPGLLLSGGIDSTVAALLVKEQQRVPHFTIAASPEHPDVRGASLVAHRFDLDWRLWLPDSGTRAVAAADFGRRFKGDDAVFLALHFASRFITDIIAADGIDEQMGGYWWHVNRNDQFPTAESAFEHFWTLLEPAHLTPMFSSAEIVGVNLHWIYLDPAVTAYISRIPVGDRTCGGVSKAVWRELATRLGVPDEVLTRPKLGFCSAFD